MKKKILSTLFAAVLIFGFLLPAVTPENSDGSVSTYSILEPNWNHF